VEWILFLFELLIQTIDKINQEVVGIVLLETFELKISKENTGGMK